MHKFVRNVKILFHFILQAMAWHMMIFENKIEQQEH